TDSSICVWCCRAAMISSIALRRTFSFSDFRAVGVLNLSMLSLQGCPVAFILVVLSGGSRRGMGRLEGRRFAHQPSDDRAPESRAVTGERAVVPPAQRMLTAGDARLSPHE